MAELLDLFFNQQIVAEKLAEYMQLNNITKKAMCDKCGISRPTLDKILAGHITSETNYRKYLYRIMEAYSLSIENLLDKKPFLRNRIGEIRSGLDISSAEIARMTGITEDRLSAIENGEIASMKELRDIAFYLGTGIECIMGTNSFMGQRAGLSYFDKVKELSGFWGHIGIMARNTKKYRWYPISQKEMEHYYANSSDAYQLVPCMNNRVLLLNNKEINSIVLLPEACDQPENMDWDEKVSCGELPKVIYEDLYEYMIDAIDEEEMSENYKAVLERLIQEHRWSEEDAWNLTERSTIVYTDGHEEEDSLLFDNNEVFCCDMDMLYSMGDEIAADYYLFETMEGLIRNINVANVSLLDMPLIKLEREITRNWMKEYEEMHRVKLDWWGEKIVRGEYNV